MGKLDPSGGGLRMELYRQGLNDRQIARAEGVNHASIRGWRQRRGLSANEPRGGIKEKANDGRMELYRSGASDTDIAAAVGITVASVFGWRRRAKLPPNVPAGRFTVSDNARRMLLYQLGWSDPAMARDLGTSRQVVLKWRRRRGLRSNPKRCGQVASLDQVYARIRRAVGRALPRDIADDAVADMCAALLDGTLPLAEIETAARAYGNRVLDRFANKFVQRSLDQELGDDDGFTLMDTLVDERSSSWLEEMGATVW